MNPADSSPLVSVVLTAYNGEKYLRQQLDSIKNQSYKNLEIVICDDASTDQTPRIIDEYASNDARIVTLRHAKNVRLHTNLESGLKTAKGEYIAISDQDDIWRLDKIEKLLGCIGNRIAIFSDSELIDGGGKPLGKTILQVVKIADVAASIGPISLFHRNVVSGHSLLFHRDLLSLALPFSDKLMFDQHLAIVASTHGGLTYFPAALVQHRIHENNQTNFGLADGSNITHAKRYVVRRREQYDQILATLELLLPRYGRISNPKIFAYRYPGDLAFTEKVMRVIVAMKANHDRFFDVRLFIALLQIDKKYINFGLRQCIKLSMAERWYQFARKIRMR